MKKTTIDDVIFSNNKSIVDSVGILTAIESGKDLPFDIKRMFYVYDVGDACVRGKHAHYKTQQLLICLNGKIDVACKDGTREVRYLLESPQQSVFIPEMIWDEQIYRSRDSVLLSICNTHYDRNDYINDFKTFQDLKSK